MSGKPSPNVVLDALAKPGHRRAFNRLVWLWDAVKCPRIKYKMPCSHLSWHLYWFHLLQERLFSHIFQINKDLGVFIRY